MRTPSSHMNGGSTIYLISGIYHSCEKMEYVFMVFQEYTIISRDVIGRGGNLCLPVRFVSC